MGVFGTTISFYMTKNVINSDNFYGKARMKSDNLGLPIEYQMYPEYFDIPANSINTDYKNKAIETILRRYDIKDILDIACGTGAQVFYLIQLGYKVVGSDFSPQLLEIARQKAAQKNLEIEFIDGDMRAIQAGQFDAVIAIDNAVGHLVKSDFSTAIKNISKNLRPGGFFVFDILNLEAMTDEVIAADSEQMTNASVAQDGSRISNERHSTIDREHGILTAHEIITIQKNDEKKQINNTCSLQIYTMTELSELLSHNGFEVVEQFKVDAYTFCRDDQGYSILTAAMKKSGAD